MKIARSLCATLGLVLAATATQSPAQEAARDEVLGPRLRVELNAAEPQDESCKLSFVVLNGHPAAIQRAVFETVVFDGAGQVDRLTLFDFGTLPAARPRVRQFVLPGTSCDDIGQILFNDAETCESADLDASACTTGLLLHSRTGIEVTG